MVTVNNPSDSQTIQCWIPRKDVFRDSPDYLGLMANWLSIQKHTHAVTSASLRFATKVVGAFDSLDLTATHYDALAGATNADTTIQTALNALPANGGEVLLMEGHFITGSGQIALTGVTKKLTGLGRGGAYVYSSGVTTTGQTIISNDSGTAGAIMIDLAGGGNHELSHLQVVSTGAGGGKDGVRAAGTAGNNQLENLRISTGFGAGTATALRVTSNLNVFRDVAITNSQTALNISGTNNRFFDCLIGNPVTISANPQTFWNCEFDDAITDTSGNQIYIGCHFIVAQTVTTNANLFLDCIFDGNLTFTAATSNNRYAGNWIKGTLTDAGANHGTFTSGSNFNP